MLPAAALEILDSADSRRVLDHARDCADCARLLGEYREVAAALAVRLPGRQPDPERFATLRARLLTRAREDGRTEARDLKVATPISRSSRAVIAAERWSGWMVAAVLLGVLVAHHAFHRPVDHGWLVAGILAVALVILGVYARVVWGRTLALQNRLAVLERKSTPRDEAVGS